MRLTLLIPDLIPARPPGGLIDVYRDLHVPDLAFLLGRARRRSTPGTSLEAWLCRAFGVTADPDLPIAALTLLAEHGNPGDAFWMRADPVHLQAQQDQLVLFGTEALAISRAEADQLLEALNAHFAGSAYTFHGLRPEHWYARLPAAIDIRTAALPDVVGRSINSHLPEGNDGAKLRKLMNEVQMLLHAHPVNQMREAQGQPAINSLWFWGSGRLPTVHARPYAHVWADNVVAQGLASAAHSHCSDLPDQGSVLLQNAAGDGEHLLVLDSLRSAASQGDHAAWQKGLRALEENWFKPLAHAYRKGRLEELTIHALDRRHSMAFTLGPRARWKFWRRPRALKDYATAA